MCMRWACSGFAWRQKRKACKTIRWDRKETKDILVAHNWHKKHHKNQAKRLQNKFDEFNGISATEIDLILRDMQSNYAQMRLRNVHQQTESGFKRHWGCYLLTESKTSTEIDIATPETWRNDMKMWWIPEGTERLQEKQCGDKNMNIMIEQLNGKELKPKTHRGSSYVKHAAHQLMLVASPTYQI